MAEHTASASNHEHGPTLGEAPTELLSRSLLHRSASVALYDVRCRSGACSAGPEELSSAHHLVFPRHGVFIRHVRGEAVLADVNHALFFQPGETHRVAHPCRGGDDCTVLAFAGELMREAVQRHAPRKVDAPDALPTHVLSAPVVFHMHERIRQAAQQRSADALALDEAALALLDTVLARRPRDAYSPAPRVRAATRELHHAQVERAKLALAVRFSDDLTLADVARSAHASAYHLSRLFRRETGLTLHQYRQRLRLGHALARIVSGERELTPLALSLGFSSHSHFSSAFRALFGVTPSACRRRASARQLRQLSKILKVEHARSL